MRPKQQQFQCKSLLVCLQNFEELGKTVLTSSHRGPQ